MEELVYGRSYQEYKKELDTELTKSAEGFVRIGYLLKLARDTDVLLESGYANVVEFAEAEYSIDKSQVSRFIGINDEFSENGYADHLKVEYQGFGYAKLALMLRLPSVVNQVLTSDYSKAEIQAIKDEVDAEKKISDMEVLLETESETTTIMEDELQKTIKQMGEDDPKLYADIWTAARQQGEWSITYLQSLMAPAGQKVYSVRIRGIGRKLLSVKDQDNGAEISLIDLRTNEKKDYVWRNLMDAWEMIVAGEDDDGYKDAWEKQYSAPWPITEEVAPVQQPKEEKKPAAKKESKVQKAPREQEKPVTREKPKQIEWSSIHAVGEIVMDTQSGAAGVLTEKTEIEKVWIFEPTAPAGKPYQLSESNVGSDLVVEEREEPAIPVEEKQDGECSLEALEEQVQGQTSIEKDFPQYMPSKTPEWQNCMKQAEDSAREIIRYVAAERYQLAWQQVSKLKQCISEMELLSKDEQEETD